MLQPPTSLLVDKFIEELEDTLELCEKPKTLPHTTSLDPNDNSPRFTYQSSQETMKFEDSSPPSVYKFKDQEIKTLRWVPTGVPEKKRRQKGRGWTPSEHELFEQAYIQIQKETMKVMNYYTQFAHM